jgi:hypothetical protein
MTRQRTPIITAEQRSGGQAASLRRGLRRLLLASACSCLLIALAAPTAGAQTPGPALTIQSFAEPTNFSTAADSNCRTATNLNNVTPPDVCNEYELTILNSGSVPTDSSSAITVTDTLPAGVTLATSSIGEDAQFYYQSPGGYLVFSSDYGSSYCSAVGQTVTCTLPPGNPLDPDALLEMDVFVYVNPGTTGSLTNTATVSGGGAPSAQSASTTNQVSDTPAGFGVAHLSSYIAGVDGQPDRQAGDHPYEFTTQVDLNNRIAQMPVGGISDTGSGDVKDVVVDLPLGFLGNAQAAPTCTYAQLSALNSQVGLNGVSECPPDSQVGLLQAEQFYSPGAFVPVWNMVPEKGVAAEFGYQDPLGAAHVLYAKVVPSPSGYVLQVTAPDVPQIDVTQIITTFFGNPAVKDGSTNPPSAEFTMPSSCDGQPLVTTAYVDSWQNPGQFNSDGTPDLSAPGWQSATSSSPPVADSPTGVHVDISVPQSEVPGTLATPPLENGVVTLPPGFTVNPSSASGLGACSPAQVDLSSASAPSCPQASQVGTVQLQTPLIPGTLTGEIYLATEFDNPSHSLLAGYIVVNDPTTGVVIKIPGYFRLNQTTGQITGVFDNNPQFPFSDLKLDFKGGPTGVLATPDKCGTLTAGSVFSPWSFPDSGPAATPSSNPFSIDSGCVSGFHPSFTAGSVNAQAGRYSQFVVSISRPDTSQDFAGLSVKLPPGMLAKLAGVKECSTAQLASISSKAGTGKEQLAHPSCPAGSQVGTVQTGAGTGPDPYFLGGKVYLTGPYKKAPYGLAVVVPAVAGPLDLGTVVVRQALYVDPTTAQVTDVSDPFPTILHGIPLRIRRIDVTLNRPDFTVNPTSCNVMRVSGMLTSTDGTRKPMGSRFQVGGCAALPFSPKMSMSLTGKNRTKSGEHPTLTTILTQPFGQANLKTARVALPLSMALDPNNSQHVCGYNIAKAVHGGPVHCPQSTIVGTATADTPLLSKPLTGPVYLVQGIRFSHGHRIRTLPTLLVPLRGQIALDLRAKTSVPNTGPEKEQLVTTFSTIPDAPVSKFTLTINGGPRGILVITGRGRTICGKAQIANTNLGAQSGKTEILNPTISKPACQ